MKLMNLITKTPKPTAPEPKRGPRIPASLRALGMINCFGSEVSGWGWDNSCRVYGLWECLALLDMEFWGTKVKAGEKVKLPGNVAWELALAGHIEFCDPRADREEEILREAAKLRVPLPAKDNPAFQPQQGAQAPNPITNSGMRR